MEGFDALTTELERFMAISSIGIGSGLDVKSIISQLIALEQKPLGQLQVKASSITAQLSSYGQLKSQMANLQDMAGKLASASNWNAMTVSSSNSAAISGTATTAAAVTSFSVAVSQLAQAQTAGSASLAPTGSPVGAGTLRIDLGAWSASGPNTFTKSDAAAVDVKVSESDTLSQIAEKINAAGAGVTATVLKDDTGERLLMRSSATGEASAFRIQALAEPVAPATEGDAITNSTGLGRLAYDPANVTGGLSLTQAALNTKATVNGVAVSSQGNKLEAIAGVTLNVSKLIPAGEPAEVNIKRDTAAAKSSISNFVASYNAISSALTEMTKYDAATKTGGTLQGDSTAVSLQATLRRMVGGSGPGGSSFSRLSDLGVEFQKDGSLKVNDTKLDAALTKPDDVKAFFMADSGSEGGSGLALRLKDFAAGLLNTSGTLSTRSDALKSASDRNTKEQERMSDRIGKTQARLEAQYSRLDASMGKLSALSNYMNQQVTQWNNTKD